MKNLPNRHITVNNSPRILTVIPFILLYLLLFGQGITAQTRAPSLHCLPQNYRPTTNDLVALAQMAADRNGVNRELFLRLVTAESHWQPCVVSPKGAKGLTQLMPGTAARFGVVDMFNPAQNLEGGARYLRLLLQMFGGDIRLALAGYNAGEGAVIKYGRRIPPYRETIQYVAKIYGSPVLSPIAVPRPLLVSPLQQPTLVRPQNAPAPTPDVETSSTYFWKK